MRPAPAQARHSDSSGTHRRLSKHSASDAAALVIPGPCYCSSASVSHCWEPTACARPLQCAFGSVLLVHSCQIILREYVGHNTASSEQWLPTPFPCCSDAQDAAEVQQIKQRPAFPDNLLTCLRICDVVDPLWLSRLATGAMCCSSVVFFGGEAGAPVPVGAPSLCPRVSHSFKHVVCCLVVVKDQLDQRGEAGATCVHVHAAGASTIARRQR